MTEQGEPAGQENRRPAPKRQTGEAPASRPVSPVLGELLGEWAEASKLPDAVADEMFARIVDTPPRITGTSSALSGRWWRNFTSDFTTGIVASTRVPRVA